MLTRFAILVFLFGMGFIPVSFAAVSLSVNPVDGSNSLRFGNTSIAGMEKSQEIHIRMTSTNGRYQVFQSVLEPMTDEKGEVLNLQAIKTQTLPNSNNFGTLYLQNSDHLSMGNQLLYSSGQGGQSDSFFIAYSLNPSLMSAGSNYRGRLTFRIEGLSDGSSDEVTIDVFLGASSSGFKFLVEGAHNLTSIHVHGSDITENKADFVKVSFSGNSGQEIRIYQEVETMPQNESDQELGADVLQLDAEGDTEGLRIQGLSSLKTNKTLIYSSNKMADNFVIYFLVDTDQLQEQQAGTYSGRIKYSVESDQGTHEFPIQLYCDVPPIFSLNITTPPGGVKFPHVLSINPPQDQEVVVTVLSNLHKPYQVLQNLQSNMTNNQGKEFNNKYFTLQVQIPTGQRGQTNFVDFSPVQTGEYPVFSSNTSGNGATFKVLYRLQGYAGMNPGDFSTQLGFSLNQK